MAKIVVADDDPDGLRYVTNLLTSSGHQVFPAADGQAGLELVRRERPELAFTNLLMPRLDGYELARHIRDDPELGGIPVIFYTATFQEREGRALARELGGAVLVKPAEPKAILDVVSSLLGKPARAGRRRPPAEADFEAKHGRVVAEMLTKQVAEFQTRRSRLDAVLDLSSHMSREAGLDDILAGFARGAREIVASRYAGIWVAVPGSVVAASFAPSGLDDSSARAVGLHPRVTGILREPVDRRAPVRSDHPRPTIVPVPGHPAATTILAAPLPFRGPWEGALYVSDGLLGRPYDDYDERVLASLAAQAAAVWESARQVFDLRGAIEEIDQSREKYRAVLEGSPNVVVAVDAEGRVAYANPQVLATFGHDPEALIGEPVERLLPDRLANAHGAHRDAYSRAPESRAMGIGLDLVGRRADGSEFPVEVGLSPIQTREGLLTFATVVDISARKLIEGQLRQSQKMEVVGQLAGGIAHDINNVLLAIVGYAELLNTRLGDDSEAREHLAGIERATDRATTLIRQLLAFSRRQVLRPEAMDLNAVVKGVELILDRLIGDAITVSLDLDPSLPPVLADPNQIELVIVNLAVNARDAMPHGGILTIETASVEVGPEYGPAHGANVPPGWYSQLSVADTGAGMDPTIRERIFEPFFTTKAAGHGTGLGLSTVFGIVKQSGGYIWVYSEPGLGTTFKVYLPQTTQQSAPSPPEKPAAPAILRPASILLVEDDDEVRNLVEKILTTAGHAVISTANPEEALRLAGREGVALDVILSDVIMPGMTGPALVKQLAARLGPLPTIFMSGYSGEAINQHGALDPAIELLEKPFTPAMLLGRIASLLADPNADTVTFDRS